MSSDSRKWCAITPEILDYYERHGRPLIPLMMGKGQGAHKRPLDVGWPKMRYGRKDIDAHVALGGNLGWRLQASDLVIDIDPRNGGDEGKRLLEEVLGVHDLCTEFPTVHTGGKGWHHYLSKPVDLKLPHTTKMFPGVEFKGLGRQVVIAGSRHPESKELYWIEDFSPYDDPAPEVPKALIDALVIKPTSEVVKKTIERPSILLNELKQLLSYLPTEDFRQYDDWFTIMASCHEATNGDGLPAFLDWCLSDPEYASDQDKIEKMWAAIKDDKEHLITRGSLYMKVKEYGGIIPGDEDPLVLLSQVDPDRKNLDKLIAKIEGMDLKEIAASLAFLAASSYKVGGIFGAQEVEEIIKEKVRGGKTGRKLMIPGDIIKKHFTIAHKNALNEVKKQQSKNKSGMEKDAGALVAAYVLDKHFGCGQHLIHAINQEFYSYNGTHWRALASNMVDKYIFETARQLAETGESVKPTGVIDAAKKGLRAMTATGLDLLRFEMSPPSAVNVTNGEIWIDETTGEHEFRDHSPQSYLRQCLEIKYDAEATCALFDRVLSEIFEPADDTEDLVRHIWELFGYAIQPKKNIASWWLFHGNGSNGKSLLVDVLTLLVGESNTVPRSVQDFTDTSKNNHALASIVDKLLILDDDMDCTKPLPDGGLKKLSENKMFEANPKGRDAFGFVHTATPVMCSNSWPRVFDVSEGMLRRANIVPFRRHFGPEEQDQFLLDKISETELSGILNRALEGLKRLRLRGQFAEPLDCQEAKASWMRFANPVVTFVLECTEKRDGHEVSVSEAYESYSTWCIDSGIKKPMTRGRFAETLQQLGYGLSALSGQEEVVSGLEIKGG